MNFQMGNQRLRINIKGRVQGVGFRPTVYRYAKERGLSGWVSNTSEGVIVEVEGDSQKIVDFLRTLKLSPPPRAEITGFSTQPLPVKNDRRFSILPSAAHSEVRTQISPDIATCPECLRELFDPANRRYLYPFINCTNCGPRFTIIRALPYDRERTTMAEFVMCPQCQREYADPLNRRFHAQPNACPKCGPQVALMDNSGLLQASAKEAVKESIRLLNAGKILAIKGLGGFHLACDATNDEAVTKLRQRKYREDKPFALMADSLETIRKYCEVSSEEERLLVSWKRPIVLLRKRSPSLISEKVAPNNKYLGFMLPYTPLHYLLFQGPLSVLVMTSGNVSDEPIAYENREALSRLKKIADYFLLHNRDIYIRCDDSVTRILPIGPSGSKPEKSSALLSGEPSSAAGAAEMVIRRSRGYVPSPLRVPFNFEHEILACGAHLKNTFALTKGNEVFVSHHIGDLENLETLLAFEKGIEHFKRLFEIEPAVIAYDLHPGYLSSQYAENLRATKPELQFVPVQHHHAHIASCMADNGVPPDHRVIGVAFDGTGLGQDGNIWGGEFLIADYADFRRVAHLKYLPLPGGEQAVREPWRMAATYLYSTFGPEFLHLDLDFITRMDKGKWRTLGKMIEQGINSPLTSSMGRFFDALSSLLGLRDKVNYEGQAAVELEMAIETASASTLKEQTYNYEIKNSNGVWIINPLPIVRAVVSDLQKGASISAISTKFHNTVSEIVIELCKRIGKTEGIDEVALSGGVFQNVFLLTRTYDRLHKEGFRVYLHSRVPSNDGGISLGQAVVANAKCLSDRNY